jgi:hypothetical protein
MRWTIAWVGLVAASVYACGTEVLVDSPGGQSQASSGGQAPGPSSTTGSGGADVSVGPSVGGGGAAGSGGACANGLLEAQVEKRPADIIVAIDNSGSMTEEILAVEQNIAVNFANIIAASGVDYRVIMVTEHGPSLMEVCIGPPLGGTTDCNGAPQFVPDQFYHYDVNVQSWDSACKLFNTLYGPNGGGEADEWALAPDGWISWLREEAVKIFVEITDDRMNCNYGSTVLNDGNTDALGQAAALAFDNVLLDLAEHQFGTVADRNYLFYSIVGLEQKLNPLDPYTQYEPVVIQTCSSAVAAGTGYQWLSKGTAALRYPMCNYQSYDVVFQSIAAGVLEVTNIPCEFEVPEPPPGEALDLTMVDLLFTPGMGMPQSWMMVAGPNQCAPGAFYLQGNTVFLCPETCSLVEADASATLQVTVACL